AADEGRLTIWSTVPHRTSEIWVLHASRRLASTKVTAFVDFIVETLGEKSTESVTTTQSPPRKSNRFRSRAGCARRYCFGALTLAPKWAAACHGQRGS